MINGLNGKFLPISVITRNLSCPHLVVHYPVSHPIVDGDFSAKYSRVASVAMAVGSCRTGPPADRSVI